MKQFSAFCVDDEASAHDSLRTLLKGVADIELMASFTAPAEALTALSGQHCDLLFLDIAMPDMSGLDFLDAICDPPITVLLTAHMEYALKAFERGVRDYLLKPVSPERLEQCLENIRPLLQAARGGSLKSLPRLSLKCGSTNCLIDPITTTRVEAAGNFSVVHTAEDVVFASETMKDLQRRLEPFGFLRIHKSHLVNGRFVSKISPGGLGMSDGTCLPLGRAYRGTLRNVFSNL